MSVSSSWCAPAQEPAHHRQHRCGAGARAQACGAAPTIAALAAAAFAAALLAGCGNRADGGAAKAPAGGKAAEAGKSADAGKPPGAQKGPGGPAGPVPVTVLVAEPGPVPIVIETVGRTEGSREVEVRARASGIVIKRLYAEGEAVREGAMLYRIDPAPFEIALEQARAALSQERARNEQAAREAARLKGLAAQRAVSQREADDAATQQKLSDAALAAAAARVRDAELNLSYTGVSAPISGIAGRSLRSEGSLATANTESALLTSIVQTDPIWVRFALSEPEYAMLRGGAGRRAEVQIALADGSVHPAKGRLNFTASTVDARLGTVQLRAEFANRDLALLPGQFVNARVTAGVREAYRVPQTAVLQGEQGRFVWTVGAENKAAPRPVQTAHWLGADWVITGGLKPGDAVIVDNLLRLRPGVPVQPGAPGAAGKAAPGGTPAGGRSESPATPGIAGKPPAPETRPAAK